jgi:SAM-dependent methyltransferase
VTTAGRTLTAGELREEVIRLGPWHIDIAITPEVSTAVFLEAPPGTYAEDASKITFHNPHDGFLRRLRRAFPDGLESRSVLDCACNCGAYLFFAKEAGAGSCFGFDIREHWIRQAKFLAEHRRQPSDDMRFEVLDLYDLPSRAPGRFDVTLFLGIFYHLPDPVTGLKMAADLTDELLILNTATWAGVPDGSLVADRESVARPMSGAYGLCWYPTGPVVLTRILNWLGFPEVRCSVWRHAPRQRPELDRIEVLAARTPGFFDAWDAGVDEQERIASLLATRTAPRSTTLVLGDVAGEVPDRRLVRLSTGGASDPAAEVARHRSDGARYVAVLEGDVDLGESAAIVFDEVGLRLYELR